MNTIYLLQTVNLNNVQNKTLLYPVKVALYPIFYWRHHDYFYINVTDLKYAFATYEFQVFARFSSVLDDDNQWSAPVSISVKTKATGNFNLQT